MTEVEKVKVLAVGLAVLRLPAMHSCTRADAGVSALFR